MSSRYDRLYTRRKKAPLWWLNKANDLHASAGAVWLAMTEQYKGLFVRELGLGDGFDMSVACGPVFLMLYGMALELLFKAVAVASGNEPEFSHDLMELAQGAGVDITEYESNQLALLTQSIIWAGRYPVPKKTDTLATHYTHVWEFLFDPVRDGQVRAKRPNRALEWTSLEPLFSKGIGSFFSRYQSP